MQALKQLFGPSPAKEAGRRLFAAASAQARQPALYAEAGVPDTVEGRFELYSLHVVILLHRLKREGSEAAGIGQALFGAYVRSLDDALRDMGVGDLSVGKKMRKLGEAFYGRVKNYDEALAQLPDAAALRAVIARTVFAEAPDGRVDAVAAYVLAAVEALARQPLDQVLEANLAWPPFEGPVP